jgi:hypothetical protein
VITGALTSGKHAAARFTKTPILIQLLQPVRQQFLLTQVLRHSDGALDFFTGLREPAQLHQQVSANAGKKMVAR